MRSPDAARPTKVTAIAAIAVLTALAGCGSTATTQSRSAATPVTVAPLAAALTTTGGTWALVAMGRRGQPLDTFWEAFDRPVGATRWTVRTPPDVADNGGLVAATARGGLVIGIRPSQNLRFTPLASTSDGGSSYTPGLLTGSLSAAPDALAVAPDGAAAALVDDRVMTSRPGLGSWRPLTTAASLGTTPAAQPCGVEQVTAVASSDAAVILGAACSRPGTVGLFRVTGSTVISAGLHLPAADAGDRVEVLRLTRVGAGMAALLDLSGGSAQSSAQSYVAAWSPTGTGAWSVSPALGASGPLTSTSVTSAGGFAVLSQGSDGTQLAADIAPGLGAWGRLPAPPARTATIAVSGGRVDALAAGATVFTDYQLVQGRWTPAQTVTVAIPFGSSN